MAALATRERAVAERPRADRGASRLFEPGSVSLEDSILAVWDVLVGRGSRRLPRLRWLDLGTWRLRRLRLRAPLSERGPAGPRKPTHMG